MLTLINLHTIDKIFKEEAKSKVSALATTLYINCITHYFRYKNNTFLNIPYFEINIKEIKNYDKFTIEFNQLCNATLIKIEQDKIVFNNVWKNYITKEKQFVNTKKVIINNDTLVSIKKSLILNVNLYELLKTKYQIRDKDTTNLINVFMQEQLAQLKEYESNSNLIKHFIYWSALNNVNKQTNEIVKSSAKLLGD